MLNSQQLGRVVHGAVAVAVVANSAVKQVVAENPVERFALCFARRGGICSDIQAWRDSGGARSHQLTVDLDHAGVAGLNWTKLGVVANLRQLNATTIDHVDEQLIF